MNWKKRLFKPLKTKEQRMLEIRNKENPSEEEQKEFVEWAMKNRTKEVEEALKKVQAIETPT